MVTVAIIGITASIAIPSYFKMLPHLRLKSAARDVASAMQSARMKAISSNSTQTLIFNVDTNSFSYGNVHSKDWVDIDIYKDTTSDAAAAPSLTDDSGSEIKVSFKSNGTTTIPDLPAHNTQEALYLQNQKNPGDKYRIRVIGTTGLIRLERMRAGSGAWGSG